MRHGKLSPVFFGSALTNFGVEPFLEHFLQMTTAPLPRRAGELVVDSLDDDFSAFVFKIQANMNKAHRDRIAFMRIVSGRFDADKEVYHVQGGKKLRLSRPQQLMAAEREIIEEAYAGDIIGVFDPGIFSIGDTLCAPGKKFRFDPIPTFAPEHFKRVRSLDTMKRKQFLKGMEQIAQEGAIQIFKTPYTGMEEVIVGVVGTLQFDVLEYRLKNEYNVELYMEGLPYEYLRWIETDDGEPVKEEDLHPRHRREAGGGLQGQPAPAVRFPVGHRLDRGAEQEPHLPRVRRHQILIKGKTAPRPAPGGGFLPRRLPHGGVAEGRIPHPWPPA